ncbi:MULTISPECIES: hypothetical protein [Nostocales]|jgi:hypothetical protein|uniref:Uncharacterized protein n=1 Tax=Dolichospermum flos-aquae UHCC 0037 TaxID=2590026 RepID=A0ACC7S4X9_DOLFA|nr:MULTISPECIES: hypothetical protein [Nostocales]MCX5984032.1 hypothetical protein [Nostocales cyanobacterium LacPavin_0920_SED1_MAG_38_18]ALB39832.1 hypothetical protein AA650_04565 [Anabaena sp. WA102]MBO1063832.1 hypothetical protein [Anabaena sp. 54]MTJ42542.1 hypothetical protein [Dolichospermum flos-aquae UHCC 0037]OBQ15713.1 MAG: hypothetical protein AN486_22070 [Anabaena sp. AL93]
MKVLFEILSEIEPVRNQKPIFTHSSFSERPISPAFTIRDWLYLKSKSSQGEDQEISRILLIKLMNNGLHIDEILDAEVAYHECHFNHQDVSGSSLAGSVYLKGILISLENAPDFICEYIHLKCSEDGKLYKEVDILNLTNSIHAKKLRPRYVASDKHTPEGKGIYRGRRGSHMDLSDEEAQSVLDQAIPNGRQYYGYYQGKFYEFQSDNVGGFHGYLVEEKEVPYKIIEHFRQ